MRLAAKHTLIALLFFLVLLGAFGFWTRHQLLAIASSSMKETARLVATETAAGISDSAAEQLLQGDATAHERLDQLVQDLAAHSDVLASISVVDAGGRVVASKGLESGRQLPPPDLIFHDDGRTRFITDESGIDRGKYHLFVPLQRNGNTVGYLRLALSSARIEQLYQHTWRQFWVFTLGGFACIGAFGLLLEMQLSRIALGLTRKLEGVVQGDDAAEATSDRDEFAQTLEAVRKVRKELSTARAQSSDAQRRFGGLMKVVDVGVVLLTNDYALDFANDPAQVLLGGSGPIDLERRWEDLRPLLEKSARTLSAAGGAIDLDCSINGRSNKLRLEFYPRDEGAGWLILVKDRGMLDALENELRLAIQMRGFAQFYLGFAHDIKAPLNAMVLNMELLKKTLPLAGESADEQLHEKQLRYIRTVVDEIARLDRSLGTVLTHAAPPNEVQQQFDLRELVEELGTLLEPRAKRQRVVLTIEPGEQPIPFTGHRDRLKQALLNIAINGLESMPHGGHMEIAIVAREQGASISVRDSGPGIPPEVLGDIFKMHFTTKDGGTGIGLHVARSVVQSHGGEIHVETDPNRGTCFRVELPIVGQSSRGAERFGGR